MKRTHFILIFLTMLPAISICTAHAGKPAEVAGKAPGSLLKY